MNFRDIQLYVMSGTGNTYRVAQWIKEIAEQHSVPAEITMIDGLERKHLKTTRKDRLYGVMFPAHGLMAPWSMIKFLFRAPSGNYAPAFILSTRGGIKLGPIVIPGAVGFGNFLAAIILMLKGYRIKGLFSVDMPVNMINLHWGMNTKNIDTVLTRAKNKIKPVMERILNGKNIFYIRNNLWELSWAVLLFWLIPIFPILYLLVGKLFMAKLMFADNRCNGCGVCASFCPNQAIKMKQVGSKKRPFWTYHCEACMRCMAYCKNKAIIAGHSWGVMLFYITSVPLNFFLLKKTELLAAIGIENFWLKQAAEMIYVIPAIIVTYWIYWVIIQIPFINTLFAYTSFTRYFRRYHEPETRLKDLLVKE
ncbi:MAG: EFR1 family ferrodoxin [Deltaproteobacteria bacterium]|nr:EFR1 family ferrodoxin [Deltaproteobacteria bacterium]